MYCNNTQVKNTLLNLLTGRCKFGAVTGDIYLSTDKVVNDYLDEIGFVPKVIWFIY